MYACMHVCIAAVVVRACTRCSVAAPSLVLEAPSRIPRPARPWRVQELVLVLQLVQYLVAAGLPPPSPAQVPSPQDATGTGVARVPGFMRVRVSRLREGCVRCNWSTGVPLGRDVSRGGPPWTHEPSRTSPCCGPGGVAAVEAGAAHGLRWWTGG
jgi:hypothetical protein